MATRRTFLGQCGALGLSCMLGAPTRAKAGKRLRYWGGCSDHDGRHFVSALDGSGTQLFDVPVPARAHAIAARPAHQEVVVFARRPGYFMLVLDATDGTVLHQLECQSDRPLCGHGLFSTDGRYLFTSENAIDMGEGVIGVHDAADGYRRIDEFPSGGIGPHEIRLLGDGRTLAVANGGILTHPDTGRTRLNLESMRPSLSYIDSLDGKLTDDFKLPEELHQLSIRHIAINARDQLCFAMQYQGPKSHHFPLVGFHRGEESLQLGTMPQEDLNRMKNYCGSVCADSSGEWFAVSAPRGNLVTLWGADGDYQRSILLEDGCGLATGSEAGEFALSSGTGRVYSYQHGVNQMTLLFSREQRRWDNHLLSL